MRKEDAIKKFIWAVILILLVILVVLVTGRRERVDIEAERAAIRETTDVEWMEAGQAKDIERWVSFHTDDALLLPPNAPIITGKEAIRAVVSDLLLNRGYEATWETTKIEVSRSGDLAYSYGPQQTTVNDAEGNPVTDQQKWVAVWKKQTDGSWKCVVLILNSDQAPPRTTSSPRAATNPLPGSRFTVQLGAYANRAQAEAWARRLNSHYQHTTLVAPVKLRGKTLYRVRIAAGTKAEAEALAARIGREEKIKTWVVSP